MEGFAVMGGRGADTCSIPRVLSTAHEHTTLASPVIVTPEGRAPKPGDRAAIATHNIPSDQVRQARTNSHVPVTLMVYARSSRAVTRRARPVRATSRSVGAPMGPHALGKASGVDLDGSHIPPVHAPTFGSLSSCAIDRRRTPAHECGFQRGSPNA